jgi:hypothetical protein
MMAELLFFNMTLATQADPEFDARRYKRGDVITIQNDNYPWNPETLATYGKLVKAPGIDRADFVELKAKSPFSVDEHQRIRWWTAKDIVNIPATVNLPNAQAFIATHMEKHPAAANIGLFSIDLKPVR